MEAKLFCRLSRLTDEKLFLNFERTPLMCFIIQWELVMAFSAECVKLMGSS